jgi:hypothetical protein
MISRASFLSGSAAGIAGLLGRAAPRPSAYVFSRPGGAVVAGDVFGHVGFAYRIDGFAYMAGAIEMAHHDRSPKGKDFWVARTAAPIVRAGAYDNVGLAYQTRYDLYKELSGGGDLAGARRAIAQIRTWTFAAPGHDCLDAVRLVLAGYGVRFNDLELRTINPNAFFRMLPGRPGDLNLPWPRSSLDASLYTAYGRQGVRDDIVAFDPSGVIFDDDIDYDPTSTQPQVVWSSFVLRRGYMAIYNKPHFGGAYLVIRRGSTLDSKQLPWAYKNVGSYVVASTPFHPALPPIAGRAPRFANPAQRSAHLNSLRSRP